MTDQSPPDQLTVQSGGEVFTFGEPEAVLDRRELFDLFETTSNGKWYEPPIDPKGLGKCYRMSSHHQSAILLKRNLLAGSFIPSRWLSRAEFSRWALDWLVMANGYLERVDNMNQRPMALRASPAAYTRVGVKPGQFWFMRSEFITGQAHEFKTGTIHHLMEPDPLQEIYGMPEYLSALQSGLLNEAATIFRRKYYKNGSHAGFILYISEEGLTDEDSKAIRKALQGAKGPGNFKNMYLHIPKGKKDGVQIMPIASLGANDEFLNIKDVTRDDVLAAHRVPPQLLGVVPKNTGGFGNVIQAARTFYELEILPIQQRMLEVNDWLGLEAVKFRPLDEMGILKSIPGAQPGQANNHA